VVLAVFFVEPDCCIGGGGGRSVVGIVEDFFARCIEDAAVLGIFGIDAEHVVAVELVLEADGDIDGAVAGLEGGHVGAVAGDGEFDCGLAVVCVGRDYDKVCSGCGPIVAGFAGGYGEFDRDFSLVTKAVIFEVAEDSLCTLRYA